jgi:hypothetical protein
MAAAKSCSVCFDAPGSEDRSRNLSHVERSDLFLGGALNLCARERGVEPIVACHKCGLRFHRGEDDFEPRLSTTLIHADCYNVRKTSAPIQCTKCDGEVWKRRVTMSCKFCPLKDGAFKPVFQTNGAPNSGLHWRNDLSVGWRKKKTIRWARLCERKCVRAFSSTSYPPTEYAHIACAKALLSRGVHFDRALDGIVLPLGDAAPRMGEAVRLCSRDCLEYVCSELIDVRTGTLGSDLTRALSHSLA